MVARGDAHKIGMTSFLMQKEVDTIPYQKKQVRKVALPLSITVKPVIIYV